jgi:hypothetical protein
LVVVVLAVVLALVGSPAYGFEDPPDPEGGTSNLRQKLEEAARSYYDTRSALSQSQKRQAQITKKLREVEISLVRLTAEVEQIAAERYKGSQMGVLNGLVTGQGDPTTLLQGAAVAEYLVWRDDEQLRQLREARDEASRQNALLDAEVKLQAKALSELDKKKRAAEKALASVGGMVTAGYSGPVPEAQPAPRTSNGGWPRETCSIKDPTNTGGCLTPRMYHALNEARLAGFSRFTRCWRTQNWGEHPKGRACDFAASKSGFGGAATGLDRTYGNRLAAWAKQNAEALGVLYVIWYRQIWMPGIGWRAYSGYGDASSEHTNHVHLSML